MTEAGERGLDPKPDKRLFKDYRQKNNVANTITPSLASAPLYTNKTFSTKGRKIQEDNLPDVSDHAKDDWGEAGPG